MKVFTVPKKVKNFNENNIQPVWALQVNDKEKLVEESSDDENLCSKTGIIRSIKYFLQNTTLHGLKYVSEEKITIPERIFFGLSFIIVIIISGIFISNVYTKWSAAPIIISTSAKQTSTADIPFPAVTICNLNLAMKSKVANISRDSTNYLLLMSLCDQVTDIKNTYRGTWKYFKAVLKEVSQPCEEMLLYCSFGAKREDCSIIFNSVLTDEGLCCTFNAIDQSFLLRNYSEENRFTIKNENHFVPIEWTPEKGYDDVLPDHFYPRKSGGTGTRMGLTVILNSSSAEYYCSKSKSIGFKVLVHNPAELPKISNYGFLVSAGREARVPIEPVYQDAVPVIRNIKKSVRRCLFSNEGDLIYYRTYSRKNCELECEATILLEQCECILYYLPRIDPSVRICGPNDNPCTTRVQSDIESASKNLSCAECWPACYELSYKPTLSSTTIFHGRYITIDGFPQEIFNVSSQIKDISILNFYYLTDTFRSTTKTEVFGFTEFLSNTGGLLGLFMGFSIFSLIEIIFFITVRPYCANRALELRHKKRQTSEVKYFKPQKRPSYKKELNFWQPNKEMMEKKLNLPKNHKNTMRNILFEQQKFNRHEEIIQPYTE